MKEEVEPLRLRLVTTEWPRVKIAKEVAKEVATIYAKSYKFYINHRLKHGFKVACILPL
jgi:hypothetical protein